MSEEKCKCLQEPICPAGMHRYGDGPWMCSFCGKEIDKPEEIHRALNQTTEKEKGLYGKYIISRTDGTPINPENRYFILKLEGEGDPVHMAACRKAVLVYAKEIKNHLPELHKDLTEKYGTKAEECKHVFVGFNGTDWHCEKCGIPAIINIL